MSEHLNDFFSADFNNWNYNEMINKPGLDPYYRERERWKCTSRGAHIQERKREREGEPERESLWGQVAQHTRL